MSGGAGAGGGSGGQAAVARGWVSLPLIVLYGGPNMPCTRPLDEGGGGRGERKWWANRGEED